MRLLSIVLAAILAGCATTGVEFQGHLESPSPAVRGCAEWYQALDQAIDAAGVRDAQAARVGGFPYLRVDRPLASLRDRAVRGEAALHAFAERLLDLDLEARRFEIDNLPRASIDALPGLGPAYHRSVALQRTRDCGRLLREIDLAKPDSRRALLERAAVPDDYSPLSRALGLYPLTRVPFAAGIRRWQEETLATFAAVKAAPQVARLRFAPPAFRPLPRELVEGVLDRARFDALGQPVLVPRELEVLAATYAPSFDVAVSGDYDRPGRLRWRPGAEVPDVDPAEPVVYVHAASTRFGERVLLQIVYSIWFSQRPPQGERDLLAGALDGIVWRVTLAPDGEPLLYDSIHPCGCYHLFFPTPRLRARPAPDSLEEWAFAPQPLPRVADGERPVVSIASGTHYIDGVSFVRGSDSLSRYAFLSYDELRSMNRMDGTKRSAFEPDGLIAGTERGERVLFWPMGIASAGAMRQWGHHATAFVGRRHFDDADLIERRFELLERPNAEKVR
jgi:hypothetical protein